jgi:hypothetical protein
MHETLEKNGNTYVRTRAKTAIAKEIERQKQEAEGELEVGEITKAPLRQPLRQEKPAQWSCCVLLEQAIERTLAAIQLLCNLGDWHTLCLHLASALHHVG